jgi:hypothetical protein
VGSKNGHLSFFVTFPGLSVFFGFGAPWAMDLGKHMPGELLSSRYYHKKDLYQFSSLEAVLFALS